MNQVHYDNYGKEYSTKDSGVYLLTKMVDIKLSNGSIQGGESDGARPYKPTKKND